VWRRLFRSSVTKRVYIEYEASLTAECTNRRSQKDEAHKANKLVELYRILSNRK
jgi:hypothetical protein